MNNSNIIINMPEPELPLYGVVLNVELTEQHPSYGNVKAGMLTVFFKARPGMIANCASQDELGEMATRRVPSDLYTLPEGHPLRFLLPEGVEYIAQHVPEVMEAKTTGLCLVFFPQRFGEVELIQPLQPIVDALIMTGTNSSCLAMASDAVD